MPGQGRRPRAAGRRPRATPTRSLTLGADAGRGPHPGRPGGVDALVAPRRRVDDDVDAARVVAACSSPLAERLADGHARLRHLRRDDPAGRRGPRRAARPALLRRHRHRRAPQRLRPPGRLVRGRPRRRRPRRRPVPRRVHPGPGRRAGRRRASRCWPRSTAVRCCAARAPVTRRRRSTPSCPTTSGSTSCFLEGGRS